jgi:hypothetical protein
VQQTTDFRTFEGQAEWYEQSSSPYYYKNWMDVQINYAVSTHVYKSGQVTPDSATDSATIYSELKSLKETSEKQMSAAAKKAATNSQARALLAQAKHFHATRDYLDAASFSKAALEA